MRHYDTYIFNNKLSMNKENEYAIITIQNSPSRTELIFLLNSFLTQNNYPRNYQWENRSGIVDIIFANPVRMH